MACTPALEPNPKRMHLVHYEGAYSMITRALQLVLTAAAIVTFSTACARDKEWQEEFGIANCNMVAKGRNAYFILEPGFQTVLEGDDTKLQITVLAETKTVDGVLTRVVEEKEWKGEIGGDREKLFCHL
jgi:hypothetical protein